VKKERDERGRIKRRTGTGGKSIGWAKKKGKQV
jgi:hypothetical protein